MRLPSCLLLWLVAMLCLGLSATAQPLPVGNRTAHSRSGQFTVSGPPLPSALPETLARSPATNWVRLQPALLAMTCERIKDALLLRLGAADAWKGKVVILLHPVRRLDDPVQVSQTHYQDGWSYRLDMPDAISSERLVEVIVQVLVVEWANRRTAATLADIPRWLTDGFAQTLLHDTTLNLILQPPSAKEDSLLLSRSSMRGRRPPPLAAARAYFATHEPLDFESLSWPTPFRSGTPEALTFQHSAEFLVNELLRLRDGGAAFARMLDSLGACRNWQTAFQQGFSPHFARMLDVDKWFALETAHFLQRGDGLTWRPAESLRQMDAVLSVTWQTPTPTNASASRRTMSLAAYLGQVTPREQEEIVEPRARQLAALVTRVSPSLAPLAREYLKLLEAHARELQRGLHGTPSQRLNTYSFNQVTRKLVTRLETLDAQRTRAAAPAVPRGPDRTAEL